MSLARFSRRFAFAAVFGVGTLALVAPGCSGGGSAPKTASVKAGSLPEGGEWTAVYYSQLFGYVHLLKEGNTINGKWETPVKDKWGEIHGTVEGDLLRFTWIQHTRGAVGPNSDRSGKGYLRYASPEGENVDDEIHGELGEGDDEVGFAKLDAIKQRDMKVDLRSITGNTADDIGGGEWDKPNKEGGNPESPTPPPDEEK